MIKINVTYLSDEIIYKAYSDKYTTGYTIKAIENNRKYLSGNILKSIDKKIKQHANK